MGDLATTAQKNMIRLKLKRRGFDQRTISFQYRLIGVPDSDIGKSVDEWLDAMTKQAASVYIKNLIGDDDD